MTEAGSDGWEHFPHEADIGVRGKGMTLAAAFRQAALGMIAVITDPESVRKIVRIPISCTAPDNETLLFDWLNALIFEISTQSMLFADFEIEINDMRLTATAIGEPIDVARHQPAVEIKGATFTGLHIYEIPEKGWIVECIVDV